MKLKKALIALTILISVHANSGFTQEEEISAEDLEVIELLDILEDLDLLEGILGHKLGGSCSGKVEDPRGFG